MKLLFVGYLHGFGGAEKMLITLANAMADRKYDVHLVSLASDNPQYKISANVKYSYLEEIEGNKLLVIKNRYDKLKKAIQELEPDLIINFWFQSAYFCAFMGKDITQKSIYAERGDPFDKEYSGLLGIIRKISFKRIRGFVFQSEGAQNCFDDSIKKRSCIIHNPVFLKSNHLNIPKIREKRIVTVGRLHEQKNQSLLIDAFSRLSENEEEYILEIYGEGELRDTLQQKIDQMNLSRRVFLKGAYSDVHERIIGASLFVLSSDYEGMPNVLLEAMSLGLPCISTDCRPGGAREIIVNEKNGLIVKIKSVEQLAQAMKYMIMHPEEAEIMGEKAKEIYRTHSAEQIIEMWEVYIRKIIERNFCDE